MVENWFKCNVAAPVYVITKEMVRQFNSISVEVLVVGK